MANKSKTAWLALLFLIVASLGVLAHLTSKGKMESENLSSSINFPQSPHYQAENLDPDDTDHDNSTSVSCVKDNNRVISFFGTASLDRKDLKGFLRFESVYFTGGQMDFAAGSLVPFDSEELEEHLVMVDAEEAKKAKSNNDIYISAKSKQSGSFVLPGEQWGDDTIQEAKEEDHNEFPPSRFEIEVGPNLSILRYRLAPIGKNIVFAGDWKSPGEEPKKSAILVEIVKTAQKLKASCK